MPSTGLSSLDALHLATALRLDSDLVVAYDLRMIESVSELGLIGMSPG